MSLRQAFAHCAIFLVAASRRSEGRVSVPLWLSVLPDQLPVIGLVSYYLTNYLIGRGLLPKLAVTPFALLENIEYYPGFRRAILYLGADSHVLLSRPPLNFSLRKNPVRLAYLKHTASVNPEP